MAKVGKKRAAFDPFADGGEGSAFPGLGEALDSLDGKVETAPEPVPRKKPAAKKARSEFVETRKPEQRPSSEVRERAKGKSESAPPPARSPRLDLTKRVKTTREEASRFDAAAMRLASELGIRVDFSKISRALWEVYLRHEEDILRNVSDEETWERPSNSETVKLAELDEKLAKLINGGLAVAARRPSSSEW